MADSMIARIAALQTKISHCMDDVGRLSDATTSTEVDKYWAAHRKAWLLRKDLDKLLELHYGGEE